MRMPAIIVLLPTRRPASASPAQEESDSERVLRVSWSAGAHRVPAVQYGQCVRTRPVLAALPIQDGSGGVPSLIFIRSRIICYQRPHCTESLDDLAPHECIPT